ncbi:MULTISPECIES: HEAT repeat domain-containing protein [Geobacter]|uniref:PBS lyase n=2 Tax=Geobacter TaxID=28231 RepID=A0A0C1TXA2_9BACT|nr:MULTISPECIES: HEAT repeat domain-containing protein [Geobacter]KIE43968.1 PBS lyase [Geobacter soli]MBE2886578.1 HEAT repeat domain-containing protein [Geobacter anodireducens]HMN02419.1 HEAT repeat domain-containing protein [Geobacter anodireducens]
MGTQGGTATGRPAAGSGQYGVVLAELYRALKALTFYPEGHPQRAEVLARAHAALRGSLWGHELAFVIGKSGFTTSEGGAFVEPTAMTQALARELFIRRVKRLTILPDLGAADLSLFITLLATDYRDIHEAGGMEALMTQLGLTTIWVNEMDLDEIRRKRAVVELARAAAVHDRAPEEAKSTAEEVAARGEAPEEGREAGGPPEEGRLEAEAIIDRMERETSDDRYRELARLLSTRCAELCDRGEFERILWVLISLHRQAKSEAASIARRGYALLAFEKAAGGPMLPFLVGRLEARGEEREPLVDLFREIGAPAVALLVERLTLAESRNARKLIIEALVAIGAEAGGLLAEHLADSRWYVVRNAAVILGEIGDPASVGPLRACLVHADARVRRETLRSLVKIGGEQAEEAVIGLLSAEDELTKRHAVISLGLLKSRRAVEPLCALIERRDPFKQSLALKRDAIQALGRIGDRRAVPYLLRLLEHRPWFGRRRWDDIRMAVVASLAQIGDPAALDLLNVLTMQGGMLAVASADAAEDIRRRRESVND